MFVCIVQWPPQIGQFQVNIPRMQHQCNIQQSLQSPALRDVAHHAKRPSAQESHPIRESWVSDPMLKNKHTEPNMVFAISVRKRRRQCKTLYCSDCLLSLCLEASKISGVMSLRTVRLTTFPLYTHFNLPSYGT